MNIVSPRTAALRVLTALTLCAAAAVGASASGSATVDPDAAAPTLIRTACPGGVWAISTIPAPGFDPLIATALQLDANNYPIRPPRTDSRAYLEWKNFVTRPDALTSACPNTKPDGRSAGETSITTSHNWSGYVAHQAPFVEAEAEWDIPVVIPQPGGNQYSSSWVGVGLGQSTTYPLMQAGTESDYISGHPYYAIWWQIYPQLGQVTLGAGYPVSAGDMVGAHVRYVSSGPTFHIWNLTQDWNDQFTWGTDEGWNTGWLSDGHAEWIYERPDINGDFPLLADAPPTFSSAQAEEGGTWEPMGSASDVEMDMTSCNAQQTMAMPSSILGPESFSVDFDSAGDNNVCGS